MKAANDTILRTVADGLIARAEAKPRGSRSAELLRDAAATILDADLAEERELTAILAAANDAPPPVAEGVAA